MEQHLTDRERMLYYKRRRYGGRGRLARALDYGTLRLILLLGAYLFFLSRVGKRATALLLAALFLAICMLVFRMAREITLERFIRRERARIRRQLLLERLALLDGAAAQALCRPLCREGETAVYLPGLVPVGLDALLDRLRRTGGGGRVRVFAPSGLERAAAAFADRCPRGAALCPPETLLSAAEKTGCAVHDADVDAFIRAELCARRERKRRVQSRPFAAGSARAYVLTALLLTAASFFTRYALYYRMLAGACMSIAAAGALLSRARAAPADGG